MIYWRSFKCNGKANLQQLKRRVGGDCNEAVAVDTCHGVSEYGKCGECSEYGTMPQM